MKWGLQYVKVTLEEADTGETVVIEQRSDGQVRCEPGKPRANRSAEPAVPPREASKPAPERREARAPRDEAPANDAVRAKAAKHATNRPRRSTSLEWKATKDAGYDGFLARSGSGQFKVLFSRTWALFFERRNALPDRLGCFRNLDKAKARAQEMHDRGMPEVEITPEQVNQFCPPDAVLDDDNPDAERPRAARAKVKPEPAAPRHESSESDDEAEALKGLEASINKLADSDDDD